MKKVLVLDSVHPVMCEMLQAAGYETVVNTKMSRYELILEIINYSGIILRSRITMDKEIIDHARKLEFIGRVGAGMESIDVDYAASKGIVCLNSPEGNRDAVAEHALGMLLAIENNLFHASLQVKSGKWIREENRGVELKGKTIGIIGYGNMGSAFARRLSGFGCRVLAYDKYKSGYSDQFATECDMPTIFEETDVLSLHVPLTAETQYLFCTGYISNFRKNIVLINTARGPVVKTTDLVDGMKRGKIVAAALDVIEYEETSFEQTSDLLQHAEFRYLAASDKVILTPHIAGWTVESKYKLSEVLANKIVSHFRNKS